MTWTSRPPQCHPARPRQGWAGRARARAEFGRRTAGGSSCFSAEQRASPCGVAAALPSHVMGVKTLAALGGGLPRVSPGPARFAEASRSAGPATSCSVSAGVHTQTPTTTTPPTTAPPIPAPVAPPVAVTIPAVGLSARVVPIGLNAAGQIEMPAQVLAGQLRRSAGGASGDRWATSIPTRRAGLLPVDGVRTGQLHRRLRISADGSHARFVISGVTEVKKTTFPSDCRLSARHQGPPSG